MRTPDRVAVVIVTYNSSDVLADCLKSLTDQGIALTEVLVVDNASTDASLEVARGSGLACVRTIATGRNGGYAAAINAGIAALDLSTVDAVMVLNPDCRLSPGCLSALAGALRRPGVGIAVPLMLNPDGTLQPSIRHEPTVRRALAEAVLGRLATRLGGSGGLGELVTAERVHAQAGPVGWATGAAMLLSREVIERVGAWDESFLLYSEETDFCLRAADAGLATWHEPAAVVTHIGGEQHASPMLSKLAIVNRVRLFRRRHNRLHGAAFFAVVAAGEGVRALLGRGTSRACFVALVRPSRRVSELPQPKPKPEIQARPQTRRATRSERNMSMSNAKPLVSIGLPVYNGAGTIEQVAASVLSQTYENIEFVIFDNASTDETEKICRELAHQDSRVRYHRNAWNIGLFNNDVAIADAVQGTFYRSIGDDDTLEPGYVQACLERFEDDPGLVMVTTGIAYVDDDGRVESQEYTGTALGSDDPADRAIEMLRLLNESHLLIDPCYGMMRPQLIRIPRRNMLMEDEILAVRFALAGRWAHIPQVLARRSWHQEPVPLTQKLLVPSWQARFSNALQVRELLRHVDETPLTVAQRARIRNAVFGMFLRRHKRVLKRRTRKLLRMAHLVH